MCVNDQIGQKDKRIESQTKTTHLIKAFSWPCIMFTGIQITKSNMRYLFYLESEVKMCHLILVWGTSLIGSDRFSIDKLEINREIWRFWLFYQKNHDLMNKLHTIFNELIKKTNSNRSFKMFVMYIFFHVNIWNREQPLASLLLVYQENFWIKWLTSRSRFGKLSPIN